MFMWKTTEHIDFRFLSYFCRVAHNTVSCFIYLNLAHNEKVCSSRFISANFITKNWNSRSGLYLIMSLLLISHRRYDCNKLRDWGPCYQYISILIRDLFNFNNYEYKQWNIQTFTIVKITTAIGYTYVLDFRQFSNIFFQLHS